MRCPVCGCTLISIHALLAESDSKFRMPASELILEFLSTLSLRRATARPTVKIAGQPIFLSTLSLRRATDCVTEAHSTWNQFLSTLSLRRATILCVVSIQVSGISIHALLAESDRCKQPSSGLNIHFYPRSPCGERLWANFSGFYWWVISIHALLAESDHPELSDTAQHIYFYPRSPCGERLSIMTISNLHCTISIHALLAESDQRTWLSA